MIVRYDNEQSASDPLSGAAIDGSLRLAQLLESRRDNAPFFARLTGDNGFEIMIGIARDVGVQYSRSNGRPPYLMAVSYDPPVKRGCVEFLAANTPTPIAARYIISFDELKTIALHFLNTGERSDSTSWQVLNPRAAREDMERPLDS